MLVWGLWAHRVERMEPSDRTRDCYAPRVEGHDRMDAWELDELEATRQGEGTPHHEFISVPDLSGGLYVLEPGVPDLQTPHTEDELYVVMSGRGRITVGDDVRDVRPGTVVFVGAGVTHRFHDIEERLVLIVAFGPAEYSRA
jgi:mannose-6-phosphate isomerase-like protein (cupin superfamily)